MRRLAGDPVRRLRRGAMRVGPGVWLAGAVCVVSLALLAHAIIRKLGSRPAPVIVPAPARQGRMGASAPQLPTNPAEWAANLLAGTGLTRLPEDPPEAVAPPGADRQSRFRSSLPGGTADIITYVIESDLPAVEAFYRGKLSAAGYRLTRRAKAIKGGRGIMLFFRDAQGQQYDVMLIPADNGKRLKIFLVIPRTGQGGG